MGSVRAVEAVQPRQRATGRDFEDRAAAKALGTLVGPTRPRCSVEVPVGGLDQPSLGVGPLRAVEAVQRGQHTFWGHFEYRAAVVRPAPAPIRCSVEVPVGALNQPRLGVAAVRAITFGAKAVKRGQRPPRGDFEDRASVVGPAAGSCSVEVPVGGLGQPRYGVAAVRAITLGAKAVKRFESLRWRRDRRGCAQQKNSISPVQIKAAHDTSSPPHAAFGCGSPNVRDPQQYICNRKKIGSFDFSSFCSTSPV